MPANAPAKYRLGRQHIVNETQVKPHYLGPMHYTCQSCQALHFMHETHDGKAKADQATFSQCCQHGKVVLPALKPTPPVLKSLICKQRPGFSPFLKNIRSYNCAFQMASSGEMCLHTVSCYQCTFVCRGIGMHDVCCDRHHWYAYVQVSKTKTGSGFRQERQLLGFKAMYITT